MKIIRQVEEEIVNEFGNNYYKSVNEFKNNAEGFQKRRPDNLINLLSFFIDLDTYNIEKIDKALKKIQANIKKDSSNLKEILDEQHDYIMKYINNIADENNLPRPTRIMFSGRGYYAFWDIKEKNKNFVGANKACSIAYKKVEKELVKIFKDLGADPKAVDTQRILKKVNTYNPKTNLLCTEVYNNNKTVNFTDFCNAVLPYTLEEVIEHNNKPITPNQIKCLTKHDYTFLEVKGWSSTHASDVINKDISVRYNNKKNNNNIHYIYNTINILIDKGLIIKGNRSTVMYLIGMHCKRINATIAQIEDYAFEMEKRIGSDFKQNMHDLNAGLNAYSDHISKKRICEMLSVSYNAIDIDKQIGKNKKIKRIKKDKLITIKQIIKKDFNNYKTKSCRDLATKFAVSKSTVNKLVNEIKSELKQLKKTIELNKSLMLGFLQVSVKINRVTKKPNFIGVWSDFLIKLNYYSISDIIERQNYSYIFIDLSPLGIIYHQYNQMVAYVT